VEEHLGYHTYREVERFQNLALALEAENGKPLTKHLANSGGALFYPESRFDLVRAGLSLYGADPRGVAGSLRGLLPAMTVSTHLVQVRKFPVGATIGYGREFRVTEPMRVGVLPLGYSDGFFRSAAGKAQVLIQGRRCPLLGRVSMNLISVDLSNVFEPELGEKVTIIGEDGGDRILVEDLARWSGTIPYEILTSMGRLAPRLTP
jgi:alanine racemase